jgi:ADP-ribose pyrophosphatase YjhB (NUDIX family)
MPGAGILPIALYKNKIYFLFGKENKHNDTPGWCDFGGGMERGETVIETSLREVEEETCGFISKQEILSSIERNGSLTFRIKGYTTTLVLIPYDKKMPEYFNKNHAIIEKYHPKLKSVLFEKDEMKWVSWEELRSLPVRSFYHAMIQILFNHQKEIQRFVTRISF